jgi:hypothetical protein
MSGTSGGGSATNQNASTPAEQTGATYTFVLGDAWQTVIFNRGTAQAITIPTNASVAFPIGTRIRCYRKGAGLPTIAGDVGVTLNKPTGIRPNRFMGVMTTKNADQTTADYTTQVVVAWDLDAYDTDAFHDTVTNNSRITIPSSLGIKKVVLSGGIHVTSSTVDVYTFFNLWKGGVSTFTGGGAGQGAEVGINEAQISFVSSPLAVADAEYFETKLIIQTDNSVTVEAGESYFAAEVVEIDPIGTIAYQYGYVTIEKIGTNEWNIEGPALG